MISIPNPCNEDFSKMTPTQRGAFCGKCQIDTFDFRNSSKDEINRALLQNRGKHLCGQFRNDQLEELNTGYFRWKNQKTKTFKSKFVLALVMVFGLSLFSCNEEEQETLNSIQTITLADNLEPKLQYVNTLFTNPEINLVDFVDEVIPESPDIIECYELKEDLIIEEELMEIHTTSGEPVLYSVMGGSMVVDSYYEYLEDTVRVENNESILPIQIENNPVLFEANAYPNPTHGAANLALEVKTEGRFEIQLYNMNGELIRYIHQGNLVIGRQSFEIDLSDLSMGMYFVKVLSESQNETVKIQRI